MVRSRTLFAGVILLTVVGLLLAHRAGYLRHGTVPPPTPAQQAAAPIAAPSAVSAVPPPNETKASTDPSTSSSQTAAEEPEDAAADEGTFVAIRYDKTHVLFRLADAASDFELGEDRTKDLPSLPKPIAEYGGDSLWEPDAQLLADHQPFYARAPVGEKWQLEITAGSSVAVIVQKPVIASLGCFSFAGVIAEAADPAFAASEKQYFLVHKPVSDAGSDRKRTSVGELAGWKVTPELHAQIEEILQARIKDEAGKMHASSLPEYERVAKTGKSDFDWAQRWHKADERLMRGEGKLDFEVQAYQLMPDGAPRLLVRVKSKLDGKAAFLMSAWLRTQPEVAIDSVDAGASAQMRMPEFRGDSLDFPALGTVLNVFDLHHDGRGELLIYNPGYEGYDIHLFRYTKSGPVATSISHGGGC